MVRLIAIIAVFYGIPYVYKNYTITDKKHLNNLEYIGKVYGNRYSIEEEYSIINCCVYRYGSKNRCICALKELQKNNYYNSVKDCSIDVFRNYYYNRCQ